MRIKKRINELCRACNAVLNKNAEIINIFTKTNLLEKFQDATMLLVDQNDGLPHQVCLSCFEKVNEYHEFRLMCHQSEQIFKDLLINKSVLANDAEPKQTSHKRARISSKKTKLKKVAKVAAKARQEHTILGSSALDIERIDLDPSVRLEDTTDVKSDEEECDRLSMSYYENEIKSELLGVETAVQEHVKISNDDNISQNAAEEVSLEKMPAQKSYNQCDLCEKRFRFEHHLKAHKRTHEGLPAYTCQVDGCKRTFSRSNRLEEHMKKHGSDTAETYTCEVNGCGKVYKHRTTLNVHKRKEHQLGPALKLHICEICGKTFKSSAVLNNHSYTHKDQSEYPFACDQAECSRRFATREKLKVHLMRHAGIKNYECPHCGMRKTTRNELKIHINYHTLERTWSCKFCQQIFNSAGNLKTHVRTVHERAKDFACRFCERSFAKPDTRKYHEMRHTGEKPNECDECGKRFTQPAAMRTHKKIHVRQRLGAKTQPKPQHLLNEIVVDGDDICSSSSTILQTIQIENAHAHTDDQLASMCDVSTSGIILLPCEAISMTPSQSENESNVEELLQATKNM